MDKSSHIWPYQKMIAHIAGLPTGYGPKTLHYHTINKL